VSKPVARTGRTLADIPPRALRLRRIAWTIILALAVASLAGSLVVAVQSDATVHRAGSIRGVSDETGIGPLLLPTPPSAPLNLQAVAGNGQVTLTWDPPTDDGGSPILLYTIYRGTSSGGESFLLTVPVVTTYLDLTVSNGVTYYYEVSATNAAGEGPKSNEASATPNPPASVPDAPQGLSATAGDATVSLAWSAPASDGGSPITNYWVYRGTSSGGETALIELGVVLAYSDAGLTNGVAYFYLVSAVNVVGEGPRSNEASATPTAPPTVPGAPQNLQAAPGNGQVTLTWQPPASDGGVPIVAYLVYRGISSGGETSLAGAGLALTYTDSTVTNGVTYYYQVSAVNAVGEGPRSNEASATPSAPAALPGAPQGLTATGGDSTVSLGWSPPSSDGGSPITNYKIYRGLSSGSESLIATVGNVLSYSDTGLTNGVAYYYQVTAVNSVGEGPRSNEASATPVAVPGSPQGLGATAGDATVALSWSAPSSDGGSPVTNYKIYRGTSSGGESLLATLGNVLSYTDSAVTNGVTYYYQVSALNSVGEGPRSNEASATPVASATVPSAPRDLRATAGDGTIALAWSAPSSNGGSAITNYRIYRGTASGQLSLLTTVPNVLSYSDTGLTNGVTYYYQVTALNAVGEGPPSNEASATPVSGTSAPTPPRQLSATAGDARIALAWLAPSSDGGSPITNYRIYRGTASGGESLLATAGNVSSYSDTTATNGVTYYYVVKAVNAIGESGASNEVSATPVAGPSVPDVPRNLVASPGNGTVTLTWTAPASDGGSPITGYTVYRGTNSGNRSFSQKLGAVTTYTDGGLSNGQRYYYVVTASNAIGEGPPSNEASAKPATVPDAPGNLQAIAGNRTVTIQWSGPAFDGGAPVTNYKIYRGTVSGSTSLLTTVGPVGSYTDTGVTNGVRYYYRVAAVNRVGEGSPSSEASAAPTSGPSVPGVPRNLQATAGNGVVTLRWSAPASDGGSLITNYTVYRGVSPTSLTILAEGKNALSLFDGGLTNGVTYYYAVAAVNSRGEGPRSGLVSATPKGTGSPPDTTKPSITIVSPVAGAVLPPGPTAIRGNASDDVGLARVEVSIDGTNWTVASGTASWTDTVNLTAGQRTIYARATDGAGNKATATVAVTVSTDGTLATGGDPSRSLVMTAVLSFAVAAGIAWFLLDRRRKESGNPTRNGKPKNGRGL
jgi:fibronectin type 3 domain-containing protein